MRLLLLYMLGIMFLSSCIKQNSIQADAQTDTNYIVIRDSMHFISPELDSVIVSIDIELPIDNSFESINIRKLIISHLLYSYQDSVANLSMPDLKDSIMKRIFSKKFSKVISSSSGSKCIHYYKNIARIESGVPEIKTFLWKEKTETYDHGDFISSIESSNYNSITTNGKWFYLLDIIKEDSKACVFSLLREEIKKNIENKGVSYCDDLYSDLLLSTCVSVINQKLHCEMMWGLPEDFEIDIPLVELQDYILLECKK